MNRLPFKGTKKRATRVLELVHIDVASMPVESYDGKSYWITFVDDFSHFTVLYFIQSKNHVYEVFKTYVAMVSVKFKCSSQNTM